MEQTQLACSRCGFISTFVAKLLVASTLSTTSSHGPISNDQPRHTMRGNYPNCPCCTRPLVDLQEIAQRIDYEERQEQLRQDSGVQSGATEVLQLQSIDPVQNARERQLAEVERARSEEVKDAQGDPIPADPKTEWRSENPKAADPPLAEPQPVL